MFTKLTEDRVLIKSYVEGDEKAFEMLLMRNKNKIYRFIGAKLNDPDLVEDIFQETFIKIINTLKSGNYNEEGKFLPWAMRIAHNLVIDHFRRASRVKLISESSSKSDDFTVFSTLKLMDENIEQAISRGELESQMVNLVEFLPVNQRDILKMRIFQNLSFNDISEMENISINTALGRMRYALMNMRKLIDKHQLVLQY